VSGASAAVSGGTSIAAQATVASVQVFRAPNAKRPFRVFANPSGDGSPLVFLVRRRVAGWVQVRLPIRPNGSLGWVRTGSVSLALNTYSVTVSLREHRITVWKGRRTITRAPAAVGRSTLPTPTGTFYIAELLRQSNPAGSYGPYAFGLSAYSTVLYSFGGGPGQIGIHGTNEPGLLGTSASHGCVRVANAVIARLARILPLGTPVVITR
jgi:lipoprotein-anchoring transpeptidase ErfK/SrfK